MPQRVSLLVRLSCCDQTPKEFMVILSMKSLGEAKPFISNRLSAVEIVRLAV